MYRSSRSRTNSEACLNGDHKLNSLESEHPKEENMEERSWMSGEYQAGSSVGGLVETSAGSSPPEPVQHSITGDETSEGDEEEPRNDVVKLVIPEFTAKELLNLPQQDAENDWNLLVKRNPARRSGADWKNIKSLTFTPSKGFSLDGHWNSTEVGDGIFAGSPLPVTPTNLNRLTERMWKEAGIESPWFYNDSILSLILSDPYRLHPLELCEEIHEMTSRLVIFSPSENNSLEYFHHRQLDPYNRYEMALEIDTVQFFHHPFFSKEHVLAEKLKSSFTSYAKRLEENQSERLEQKLRAFRDTVRHTQKIASGIKDQTTLCKLQRRLDRYRTEMEHVREERDESFRLDKSTMEFVLHNWKMLKKLRREQKYSSTEVQLKIISLEVNKPRDKEIWNEEIEEEMKDLQDAFSANFERQMREYRRKLRRWTKAAKVPAEKPFEGGEGGNTENESVSMVKPLPPSPFQEFKVRETISTKFAQFKRPPNEPKLMLEIGKEPITPTEDLPSSTSASGERRRRIALEASKLRVRIWYNMKMHHASEKRRLNPDFTVPFHTVIKLPIKEVPECLHLELRQDGKSLHVLELPIPNSSKSFERSSFETVGFVSSQDEVIKSGHGGVGSGVKFTILSESCDGLPVSGDLCMRFGWSTGPDESLLCPKGLDDTSDDKYDKENQPISKGSLSFTKQTETRTKCDSEPDPNDPKTTRLHGNLDTKHPEFKLKSVTELKDYEFCDSSEIENSKRLRLLFLRDQDVPEFKNMRMVGSSEAEIFPDEYEKRLAAEVGKETREIWKEVIESDNFNAWDRLQPIREIRSRLLESFVATSKQLTFEDLVLEEEIPDIGTLGLNLMSIFQPRRPLRPQRKERKRIQTTLLMHTDIQLVVNIVRAINLPLRKDSQTQTLTTQGLTGVNLSRKGVTSGNWAYGVVKPFVEVWFQRKVSRTATALGPDPTWNQELQIALTLDKEDCSESVLSHLEEDIYLQVYDEVAIDLLEDERRRETDVHQRLEKRWLGCIRIPFSTLYRSGRIEGTLPLSCPPILLGYEGKFPEGIGESYVTLFITLQPAISPPAPVNDVRSIPAEIGEMLEHVKAWMIEVQKAGRIVKPFVLTPSGDTVLASRYLAPIEPPDELFLKEPGSTLLEKMKALAHYVSLFPSLPNSTLTVSQYTLWFTPDVFVNTPGGGREDHSILLASFFLHLGVRTYIVQGESIDGPTTHVLTLFKKSAEQLDMMPKHAILWNSYAGTYTRVNDSLSSLHSVCSVIGQYNIWGNVSLKDRSDELDWEVEKSRDWLPLFPNGISESKLPRLQFGPVIFSEGDEREGNRLGQRLERHLRDSFMKWRQSRTTWNRYSTTKLRSLLPLLEERRVDGSPTLVQEEHLGELKEILKSFDMTGFPLHQPYSTLDCVIESVYSTGLHTIDTSDVQFALGAYAKAYPASIFSLWVYIAALHPIK